MRATIAALALCACSTSFDLDTTSDSQSAPEGVEGEDFGVAVVAVAQPRIGVTFAVAGTQPLSVSTYAYDQSGVASFAGTLAPPELQDPGLPVLRALTGVPPQMDDDAIGMFGVGIPGRSGIAFFDSGDGTMPPIPLGAVRPDDNCGFPPDGLEDFGVDFVLAHTNLGEAGEADLFVVADDELVIFPDFTDPDEAQCSSHCAFDGELKIIALDRDIGAGGELELALLVREGMSSSVSILDGATLNDRGLAETPCIDQAADPILLDGPFDVFAAGPIDATAGDVVIAIDPMQGAFQVIPASGTPSPRTNDSRLIGTRSLNVVDIDRSADRAGAELLIGVPDGPDGDDGVVHIMSLIPPRAELELISDMQDSDPFDGQVYGRSVAVGGFRAGGSVTPVPMVGALDEVFTVFRATVGADDPRE
jgi:hypothetical protein